MVKIVLIFLFMVTLSFVCLSVENIVQAMAYDFTATSQHLPFKEDWNGSHWPFLKSISYMAAANFTLCIAHGFKKDKNEKVS